MTIAASVVTYTVQEKHAEELTERVRQHLIPVARELPGYRGFLLLDQGDNKRLAILIFESIEQARGAQRELSPVGEEQTYPLMDGAVIGSIATGLLGDGIFV